MGETFSFCTENRYPRPSSLVPLDFYAFARGKAITRDSDRCTHCIQHGIFHGVRIGLPNHNGTDANFQDYATEHDTLEELLFQETTPMLVNLMYLSLAIRNISTFKVVVSRECRFCLLRRLRLLIHKQSIFHRRKSTHQGLVIEGLSNRLLPSRSMELSDRYENNKYWRTYLCKFLNKVKGFVFATFEVRVFTSILPFLSF